MDNKENRKNIICKNQAGITLIALAITIIVLLILAGVSITFGNQGIRNSKENVQLSELGMVQNAVLQRKTKDDLTQSTYPGEKINDVGIDLDEVISDINMKRNAEEEDSVSRKDENNQNYYFLSISNGGLKDLGIKNSESEYIVNYETGEVINYTERVTAEGKPLYIYAKETE